MVESSIVRIGPTNDNVSATLLRTALVSYFQGKTATTTTTTQDIIDDEFGSTISISNKYFTANVLLEEIGASTPSDKKSKEDGVILVFDAMQSNPDRQSSNAGGGATTFDSLSAAHNETESKDNAGDLLRLCVGVTLTTPSSPEELRGQNAEKEYSRRILWCLDRGYEYVEADLSKEGQSCGHDERDKEGFARIVEAVQGTVWSSAVMSTAKTKELKDSFEEDKRKALQEDEKGSEKEENPYEPPDPKLLGGFGEAKIEESSSMPTDEDVSGMVLDPEKVGPQEMANLRKDLEADQLFEKMEGVLREATRIRDASRNGGLTDEERRDRAGEAAMALVNLMGQFGLDDDDDSQVEDTSDEDSGVIDSAK